MSLRKTAFWRPGSCLRNAGHRNVWTGSASWRKIPGKQICPPRPPGRKRSFIRTGGLSAILRAICKGTWFLSSLTESQMIAAITGFAVGLSVYLLDNLAKAVPVQFISTALQKISFMTHYQNFTVGLLSFADVVFFLSVITLFVFLTVRVIEKKRWS